MFTNAARKLFGDSSFSADAALYNSNSFEGDTSFQKGMFQDEWSEAPDFSFDAVSEQDEAASNNARFESLFEPVYRRENDQFVPAGYKVTSRLKKEPSMLGQELEEPVVDNGLNLMRLLEAGVDLINVVEQQIEFFLEQKRSQSQHKIILEVDLVDLEYNQRNLWRLVDLIKATSEQGLNPSDFVIELSSRTNLDAGIVYTIASELRRAGVMIALTQLSPDAFSFSQIFQIAPDVVKFDRAWCDLGSDDPELVSMLKAIAEGFHKRGVFTNLSGIQTHADLRLAFACNFTRAQGPFFGAPQKTMALDELVAA
ncbi:MAG: EAL domain-containing protein [Pseudomonadota bacterium]